MNSIVLVGPRKAGKTEVGKIISDKTGLQLVNTDDIINELFGTPKQLGWEKFRMAEAEVIEAVASTRPYGRMVLSLGGGAVADDMYPDITEKNRKAMAGFGLSFYLIHDPLDLVASAKEYVKRTGINDAENRPPLTGSNSELEEMIEILEKRHPIYSSFSHHTITTKGFSPVQTARQVAYFAIPSVYSYESGIVAIIDPTGEIAVHSDEQLSLAQFKASGNVKIGLPEDPVAAGMSSAAGMPTLVIQSQESKNGSGYIYTLAPGEGKRLSEFDKIAGNGTHVTLALIASKPVYQPQKEFDALSMIHEKLKVYK